MEPRRTDPRASQGSGLNTQRPAMSPWCDAQTSTLEVNTQMRTRLFHSPLNCRPGSRNYPDGNTPKGQSFADFAFEVGPDRFSQLMLSKLSQRMWFLRREVSETKPTEILSREHKLIKKALDCLLLSAQDLETGNRPPPESFEHAIEFAETFTHNVHHFKEEYLLFARLAQKKGGEIDGEVEALRQQHERGREIMAAVGQSLDGYAKGEAAPAADLAEALNEYVALLERHIHREEHVFYPMADHEMSEQEREAIAEEFGKEDDRVTGKMLRQSGARLVDRMSGML